MVFDNVLASVHLAKVKILCLRSCQWGESVYLNCGHQWACCSSPRWMSNERHGGWHWRENRRTRRKTCPSASLCSTNLMWTDLGANLGLCSERPVINRLSHGTVSSYYGNDLVCLTLSGIICWITSNSELRKPTVDSFSHLSLFTTICR
jgi:hypothetical protein